MKAFLLLSFRVIAFAWLLASDVLAAGTWTPLQNNPPGPVGVMILLSDGTVLAEHNDDSTVNGPEWYRLTPDNTGSYIKGTWTTIASMNDTRLFFASQVLKDGRLFVAGGEYGSGLSTAEIYDPVANTWTKTSDPAARISDANSEILPDGRVLVALVQGALNGTKIYDPATDTWSAGPNCTGIHNESAWVKLPDASILMVNRGTRSSERYIPSLNKWMADATVPVDLYEKFGDECGPGFLLPNGTAFFIGGTGHTAIYTPSGSTANGTWVAGPDMPNSQGMPDAPGVALPNGNLLLCTGKASTTALGNNDFLPPSSYYEYDYVSNTFTQVNAPGGGLTENVGSFQRSMLMLPDGSVLSSVFTNQLHVYTPTSGAPLAIGKPTITSITPVAGVTYHMVGIGLNGISEGAAYGDDAQVATNYPIVRFTDALNRVSYAKTFNWTSTGVFTGATPIGTDFNLPAGLPPTGVSVEVVANGNSSGLLNLWQVKTTSAPPAGGTTSITSVGTTITTGTFNYIPNGSSVTVTATPNPGYRFDKWTEGPTTVSTTAAYTFAITQDRNLTANFVKIWTVTVSASPNFGGSVTGGGVYDDGTSVTVKATPVAPYIFVNWTESGVPVSTTATYTFTVTADRNLVANFVAVWTVRTSAQPSADGGTTGDGSYIDGTSVTVTATPNPGYGFLSWTEPGVQGVVSTSLTYTFAIHKHRMLFANFAPLYTINVSSSSLMDGTASGTGTYTGTTSVTVKATPSLGFSLLNWTENGTPVSTSPNYTFAIGSNRTLVANYTPNASNAYLTSLIPGIGKLSPVFTNTTTAYTLGVNKTTLGISFTPFTMQSGATVKISGTPVASGTPSAAVPLSIGANVITVAVTSQDTTVTNNYTVTVTRSTKNTPMDINGDGFDDLVFQNTAGQIYVWYMNGAGAITSGAFLSSGGLGDWKLAAIADLNNDGVNDLVFQNSPGQIYVWYLNANGSVKSGAFLNTASLGGWRLVGAADMNNDGNADLVFQHTSTTQIGVWYMDGTGKASSSAVLSYDSLGDWKIAALADMNNDGNTDIVFQNNLGQIYVWYLDGAGRSPHSAFLSNINLGDWRLVHIADMNGDGNADLIFQNTAGQIFAWYMNGSGSISAGGYLNKGSLGDWRLR